MPVHEEAGGDQVWLSETTGCTGATRSTYTPGHDAKLRSLLVQAGIGGHQVRRTDGKRVVGKDALRWAAELGWEADVRQAVDRHRSAG